MYPRPKARRPGYRLRLPDPERLAEDIGRLREERGEPAAIISGIREWREFRRLPTAEPYLQFWPGGDVTFCRVAVILRPGLDAPALMETQGELEEALLP